MIPSNLVDSLVACVKSMTTYQQSQQLRAAYLHQANEAGVLLNALQKQFKADGHCTSNPLVIADKDYTSFTSLLDDIGLIYKELVGPIPDGLEGFFNKSYAAKCMSLASNWNDAVEIVDFFSIENTYRLTKSLEIISWYKRKKKDNPNADPTQFTCDLYWAEQKAEREARRLEREAKPSYYQLELEIQVLREENAELRRQLELRSALAASSF